MKYKYCQNCERAYIKSRLEKDNCIYCNEPCETVDVVLTYDESVIVNGRSFSLLKEATYNLLYTGCIYMTIESVDSTGYYSKPVACDNQGILWQNLTTSNRSEQIGIMPHDIERKEPFEDSYANLTIMVCKQSPTG